MILICGMPKSGATFLLNLLEKYGDHFESPIVEGSREGETSPNEPKMFSCDLTPLTTEQLRGMVERFHKAHDLRNVVLSHHNLTHRVDEIADLFDYIIFCWRPLESWLESANTSRKAINGPRPYWMKSDMSIKKHHAEYEILTLSKFTQLSYYANLFIYTWGENSLITTLKYLDMDKISIEIAKHEWRDSR